MSFDLAEYLQSRPIIALVGATNQKEKFGNIIFHDLLRKNFRVIPVNPRATTIDGVQAFKSLSAAANAENIDLVVYVVPPKITLETLKESKELGLTRAWVQPGAGDESVRMFLEENKYDYLMNACVMVQAS